jgi:type IV secretion system protein VirB1
MIAAAAFTLAQLLHICAPDVGERTMTAIVTVESGGNPLAIHDNTLRRSFSPHDTRQAVAWANQLLALHHSVDLGLSQINNANLPRLGLSVTEAFDACSNLSGGSLILAADYRAAAQRFGPGQYALRSAIGAYNTGSLFAGFAYVDRILAAAGLGASKSIQMPDLQAPPLAARYATAAKTRAGTTVNPIGPTAVAKTVDPANAGPPTNVSTAPAGAASPASIGAPSNTNRLANADDTVQARAPVQVVRTKPRITVHTSDTGTILVTTGLQHVAAGATNGTTPYRTNGSAMMLRVSPPPPAPPAQQQ